VYGHSGLPHLPATESAESFSQWRERLDHFRYGTNGRAPLNLALFG